MDLDDVAFQNQVGAGITPDPHAWALSRQHNSRGSFNQLSHFHLSSALEPRVSVWRTTCDQHLPARGAATSHEHEGGDRTLIDTAYDTG